MDRILDVSHEGLTDLCERIKDFSDNNITVLLALRNRLSSVELPEGFENLVELDLQDNAIEIIPDLENQKKLKILNLSYNIIRKIGGNLSSNLDLEELLLASNNIKKIEGIDHLKYLKTLELGFNKIETIESIEHLVYLEKLWLGKNRIKEITNISGLNNLRILSLQNNLIFDLCGLDDLVSLEELYLSCNRIKKINSLKNLSNLKILDLAHNQIVTLDGLEKLEKLNELWINNNFIVEFKEVFKLEILAELKTIYLEKNPFCDVITTYSARLKHMFPQLTQIDAEILADY